MFEELFHLLTRLGVGAASRPVCDLVADLTGESMSLQQLQQEIRNVLRLHGCDDRVGSVIAALVQMGFATATTCVSESVSDVTNDFAENTEAASAAAAPFGASPISDSAVLEGKEFIVVVETRAPPDIHETARGWLDIDSGIYVDVRQHGAGSDSER
jgi:hypothetical protein